MLVALYYRPDEIISDAMVGFTLEDANAHRRSGLNVWSINRYVWKYQFRILDPRFRMLDRAVCILKSRDSVAKDGSAS